MKTIAEEIRRCRYLDLERLEEPEANSLRIFVNEARVSGEPEDLVIGGVTIPGTGPIVTDKNCARFEFAWETYIAYSVCNESYTSANDYDRFEGDLFRVFSVSHFLDYIFGATFASSDYPGPFRHYGLVCLNHIVDVISTEEPHITQIPRWGPPTEFPL
jgi:hypothetical protein